MKDIKNKVMEFSDDQLFIEITKHRVVLEFIDFIRKKRSKNNLILT